MSALKRSDWRKRVCTHGNRVEHRLQIDAAYCNEPGCAARALSPITKAIPDPSREAMREALETAAQEMDLLAEIGPGDPEMARVRWDVLSKRFRAALALDGDAK